MAAAQPMNALRAVKLFYLLYPFYLFYRCGAATLSILSLRSSYFIAA
jgi:hypothetical protein